MANASDRRNRRVCWASYFLLKQRRDAAPRRPQRFGQRNWGPGLLDVRNGSLSWSIYIEADRLADVGDGQDKMVDPHRADLLMARA